MPGTAAPARLGTAHGEGEPGRTRRPAQIPRSQIDSIFKILFFSPPFLFSSVFFGGASRAVISSLPSAAPGALSLRGRSGQRQFHFTAAAKQKLFSKEINRSTHPPRGLLVWDFFCLFVGGFFPLKYTNLVFYFAIKVSERKKIQNTKPNQNTRQGFCAFKRHCPDSHLIYCEAFIFAIAESPVELYF